MSATALAHPTIGATAVVNDIALNAGGLQLVVVSGSNMSGKSTWLRAVGSSVVLSWLGAPVRARACRMSALSIGAAIRLQDSLTDGRSRFFAEITRLKQVVDLARDHHGVLFLLDEILSGTNSHDRRIGAEALMLGLVAKGAIGLVTTHDLALAAIVDRLPGRATNTHFADTFANGVLTFDYQLRPGIVETSNALALMRSIGLEV
jgi:DNA mismatch repair ATPase MutS